MIMELHWYLLVLLACFQNDEVSWPLDLMPNDAWLVLKLASHCSFVYLKAKYEECLMAEVGISLGFGRQMKCFY